MASVGSGVKGVKAGLAQAVSLAPRSGVVESISDPSGFEGRRIMRTTDTERGARHRVGESLIRRGEQNTDLGVVDAHWNGTRHVPEWRSTCRMRGSSLIDGGEGAWRGRHGRCAICGWKEALGRSMSQRARTCSCLTLSLPIFERSVSVSLVLLSFPFQSRMTDIPLYPAYIICFNP
ncbi:hypothetical protein B0H11DRAFT_281171 [Mycena galericulata]|nr:hypothetical protein B0H11DRAFT_281171 [Mycena galericulata]